MENVTVAALNGMQQIKKQAKGSPLHFQLTRRRYRNPAGYSTWEEVALTMAAFLELSTMMPEELRGWTVQATNLMSLGIAEHPSPCYWLSRSLAEALIETELPPVCDLKKIIPFGCLMLPKGFLKDPDGFEVNWLGILQMNEEEYTPSYLEHHGKLPMGGLRVGWAHILPNGVSYCQNLAILPDQPKPVCADFDDFVTDADREFSKTVFELVIKCLLVMQSRPDLIEAAEAEAEAAAIINRKLGKRQQAEPLLNPRWIGKNYRPRREEPGGGTHASPVTHWRRGHLKRVAIGTGRKARKWTWIEPTLVNA